MPMYEDKVSCIDEHSECLPDTNYYILPPERCVDKQDYTASQAEIPK